MAFVRDKFKVNGDLVEAIRFQLSHSSHGCRERAMNLLGRAAPWRLTQWWRSHEKDADFIRFHYDRSNNFYRQFLDSRMVYSCAYFRTPSDSLDEAQLAKLDLICHKLRLKPGDRFLDIGCGWGALVLRAAQRFSALAAGCTLSHEQVRHAAEQIRNSSLETLASVHERDYREMDGQFDRIASVGMVEHVGRHRLREYFRSVYKLLRPGGLFLNHGITRPARVHRDAQTFFIARQIFPGGEIVTLSDMICAAEQEGFEVLDVEELRPHYALTTRHWVERLRAHREECLETVSLATWKSWQLYLAGSSLAFQEGGLGVHQILLFKPGDSFLPPAPRAPIPPESLGV
ncbi:MAG: class I SAM-dependent methyltransferase [Bryobacterales bacterium]|nr:class I SAM-dependent methyltransferase [Bryobacterales bacterium]